MKKSSIRMLLTNKNKINNKITKLLTFNESFEKKALAFNVFAFLRLQSKQIQGANNG